MTVFAVEYIDDQGDIIVVLVDKTGVIDTQIPNSSIGFKEPEEGSIGISVVMGREDDLVYEGAIKTTYQRIAQLALKDETMTSQETAEAFLSDPRLFSVLGSIYSDFKKEYPNA